MLSKNFIFELNTSNFESTTLEVVVLSKSRVIFDYEVKNLLYIGGENIY